MSSRESMPGSGAHWDGVYGSRAAAELSWFQAAPTPSLEVITAVCVPPARIIDVGAGSSTLVDELLDRGFGDISLVDLSAAALAATRARLGEPAGVEFLVADALSLDTAAADLWHDRAAFHFLVDGGDKARYAAVMARHVRPGGHAVLATFAADGPERCSGLPVSRYSPEELESVFAPEFRLVAARRDIHTTPSGVAQPFTWVLLRRGGEPDRTG